MRIHFIAIGGAAMHNLAIALKNTNYIVSGPHVVTSLVDARPCGVMGSFHSDQLNCQSKAHPIGSCAWSRMDSPLVKNRHHVIDLLPGLINIPGKWEPYQLTSHLGRK